MSVNTTTMELSVLMCTLCLSNDFVFKDNLFIEIRDCEIIIGRGGGSSKNSQKWASIEVELPSAKLKITSNPPSQMES